MNSSFRIQVQKVNIMSYAQLNDIYDITCELCGNEFSIDDEVILVQEGDTKAYAHKHCDDQLTNQ